LLFSELTLRIHSAQVQLVKVIKKRSTRRFLNLLNTFSKAVNPPVDIVFFAKSLRRQFKQKELELKFIDEKLQK
jgi:hypothetical protein